jgi:putative copper export protein
MSGEAELMQRLDLWPLLVHGSSMAADPGGIARTLTTDVLPVVMRFAIFAGVILVIGTIIFERGVLVAVQRHTGTSGADTFVSAAAGRAWGLSLVVAAAMVPFVALRFVLQVREFSIDGGWLATARAVLGSTVWGKGWLFQLVTLVLFIVARTAEQPDRMRHASPLSTRVTIGSVVLGVIGMALAPALTGHAIASPDHPALAVVADTVHVLAGGAWLGTLAVLLIIGIPTAATAPSRCPEFVGRMVRAFSPIALTSVAAILVTGTMASWMRLDRFSSLWQSPYGRLLATKVGVFALIMIAGAYNWRWVTPRLGSVGGVRALTRSATVEVTLAAMLVALTALLVATALPWEG